MRNWNFWQLYKTAISEIDLCTVFEFEHANCCRRFDRDPAPTARKMDFTKDTPRDTLNNCLLGFGWSGLDGMRATHFVGMLSRLPCY